MILTATGLHRRYGRREVVRRLDLQVGPGEVVGLLGPNGAGKTTTFRLLTGLLAPHAGTVRLGAHDITRWPLWRRARAGMGYLPQGASVFRRLTVGANLDVALARSGLTRGARHARRAALLTEHGLEHLAEARGDRLSGGERRRVEIARALAANPSVLLVDEPFAGLDPHAVTAVTAQLRRLANQGVGVLLTDHRARQALEACDRLYILADGDLLAAGSPSEIAQDPVVRARYLGDDVPSAFVAASVLETESEANNTDGA